MIWASWSDFFAMGGYAFYIWGSVIVVAICMVGEIIGLKLRRKSLILSVKLGRKVPQRPVPKSAEKSL